NAHDLKACIDQGHGVGIEGGDIHAFVVEACAVETCVIESRDGLPSGRGHEHQAEPVEGGRPHGSEADEGTELKMDGELQVLRLGRVEYEDGLTLMAQYGAARREGKVPDTLLLLEHPPVLTMGRSAESANVVTPRETLEQMGIRVHETNRGGDVTYHGPGQIVGYPIFLLPPGRQDVRRYVRDVET